MPANTTGQLQLVYEHADEAEAMEHEAAASASSDLRDRTQAISQWLAARWVAEFGALTTRADPARLQPILVELRDRLAAAHFDSAPQLTYWAERARTLGITQAAAEMGRPFLPDLHAAAVGRDTARAITQVAVTVADRLAQAQRVTRAISDGTHTDVMPAIAIAYRAVTDVERASRWVTNREVNNGAAQVATALGAGTLWIAERNACLVCIALSGVIADPGEAFPADATFGPRPMPVWPDGVLDRPPRHPHCRCRITPWLGSGSDYSLSDALKREARRSVLKGWSLPSESENARLQAADRLLRVGANLPKTVEEQARRAVRRGHFKSRTVPNG